MNKNTQGEEGLASQPIPGSTWGEQEMERFPASKKKLPPIADAKYGQLKSSQSDLLTPQNMPLSDNDLPIKYEQLMREEDVVEVFNLTKGQLNFLHSALISQTSQNSH